MYLLASDSDIPVTTVTHPLRFTAIPFLIECSQKKGVYRARRRVVWSHQTNRRNTMNSPQQTRHPLIPPILWCLGDEYETNHDSIHPTTHPANCKESRTIRKLRQLTTTTKMCTQFLLARSLSREHSFVTPEWLWYQ